MEDPYINWRDAWRGTSSATAYGATNAMVKIIFSYAGYTNAFGLVNEMKVSNLLSCDDIEDSDYPNLE